MDRTRIAAARLAVGLGAEFQINRDEPPAFETALAHMPQSAALQPDLDWAPIDWGLAMDPIRGHWLEWALRGRTT